MPDGRIRRDYHRQRIQRVDPRRLHGQAGAESIGARAAAALRRRDHHRRGHGPRRLSQPARQLHLVVRPSPPGFRARQIRPEADVWRGRAVLPVRRRDHADHLYRRSPPNVQTVQGRHRQGGYRHAGGHFLPLPRQGGGGVLRASQAQRGAGRRPARQRPPRVPGATAP